MRKVTVLGGGTGTFVVLSGLKKYPIDLAVIVSMMDSGGSTGKLRDQLGVLPPGDLRQCLVALSEAPVLWRKLFLYRFRSGDLAGHNFGNVFLSALEKVSKDYNEVVDTASYVLQTRGQVIPVTFMKAQLCCEYDDGKIVKGEGKIEEIIDPSKKIKKIYLDKKIEPNEKAIDRLKETDFIVIGPGDLYTSIAPILLVPKIKQTITSSKAKVIFIMNLMTKAGQTHGFSANDHLRVLEQLLDKKIDIVIVNDGLIPKEIVDWYASQNEHPVINDLDNKSAKLAVVRKDVVSKRKITPKTEDKLARSILRHDPDRLAKVIKEIIS